MKVDGRGIGATTRRALTLIDRGKEPFEAGRLANQENPGRSAGNGSVMRCAPVALLYHNDPDRLMRVSTQQAAITHSDERCTWGAVAVNLAARELLHGNIYFVDEVLHRLGDRAPRVLRDAIHRVPRESDVDAGQVSERLDELWARIDAQPKSLKWKLRARVGDRLSWYELPEEVRQPYQKA